MILVDTSVWIDLLIDPRRFMLEEAEIDEFVTCAPVVQEVLQGFTDSRSLPEFRKRLLSFPCLSDPTPLDLHLKASEIFQDGRRRGLPIRSSTDCLIAAIAIENSATLWHRDRDFTSIARYTRLRADAKYLT
jgi:predicted nucleic acid-binding protein